MRIDSYYANIMFSYLRTPKTLKLNYPEYKCAKERVRSYAYCSNGKIQENTIGLFFDQRI